MSNNWKSSVNLERVLLAGAAGAVTLFSYWYFVGSHNRIFRKSLISQLNDAKHDVSELEDQLNALEAEIKAAQTKKEVRIFVDGAFDLFHFGHMNAFRQARELGTFLIVGVNSDESITRCKGGKHMSVSVFESMPTHKSVYNYLLSCIIVNCTYIPLTLWV